MTARPGFVRAGSAQAGPEAVRAAFPVLYSPAQGIQGFGPGTPRGKLGTWEAQGRALRVRPARVLPGAPRLLLQRGGGGGSVAAGVTLPTEAAGGRGS